MGFLGPNKRLGPDYRLEHRENFEFTGGGPELVDGLQHVAVGFRQRENGSLVKFVLDPSRGFLPARGYKHFLRSGKVSKEPSLHMRLLKARECTDGRWFPEEVVLVTVPDNTGSRFDVQEIKLIELEVDPKLTDDDFSISMPAGTMVLAPSVPETEGVFFRTKQGERVNLRDLEGMFALIQKKKADPLADTAIPHAAPWTWRRWALVIGGGAIALFGLVVTVRKRASRRLEIP